MMRFLSLVLLKSPLLLLSVSTITSSVTAFSFRSFSRGTFTVNTCLTCGVYNYNKSKVKTIMKSIRKIHKSALHYSSTHDNDGDIQTINILCLHGKGNNAFTFQQTLEPFEHSLNTCEEAFTNKMSFHFEYISAPFPIIVDENDNSTSNDKIEKEDEDEDRKAMQWWTLPPGVRSFNAKEYQGFEISKERVMNELRNKEYDFVLGHSQGAILLSALMVTVNDLHTATGEGFDSSRLVRMGFIFNGAAWPNPYTNDMENYQYPQLTTSCTGANSDCFDNHDEKSQTQQQQTQHEPNILFVIGEKDKINPPEGAIRVRDAFIRGGMNNVQTLFHPGGHSVPVKNEQALSQMTKWIVDIVLESKIR